MIIFLKSRNKATQCGLDPRPELGSDQGRHEQGSGQPRPEPGIKGSRPR